MTETASQSPPPRGRILGLDVGERRIGVAISDPEQRLAVPLNAVARDERGGSDLRQIGSLAEKEDAVAIVVGLPISLSGEEGAQAAQTRRFAEEVAATVGRPLFYWDERLTSREAERRRGPSGRKRGRGDREAVRGAVDALAAAIILQAFLDSRRLSRGE